MPLSKIRSAVRKGYILGRSYSEAQKMSRSRGNGLKNHTIETKEQISKIMISKMQNRYTASKRVEYKGIKLESSYELELAIDLDTNQINWLRPQPLLYRDDKNQQRRYYPDFYLPEYQLYLDPKNSYCQKLDKRKLELVEQQNGIKLLVLDKMQCNWKEIKKLI